LLAIVGEVLAIVGHARGMHKVYMRDRSRAADDFPKTELYMAFDGGSGFDFWLPHVAPHAVEGPNKVIDKLHSSPLKVMNGSSLKAILRPHKSQRLVYWAACSSGN